MVPLDFCKDIDAGSALDFSGFGLLNAPADKYGWAKNVETMRRQIREYESGGK